MLIPSFVNMPLVDKNGIMTPEWCQFFNQLISELQNNVSNEGYKLPFLSTSQINQLADVNKSGGSLVYDSTLNLPKININGTWKTFDLT